MYIRNKLYDSGIFKSHKVTKPVISIGNITTGGTGKTPLTIFIAIYFLTKGKKVGIISRGYGRKSQELVIVSDGININENTYESGDELILIANELVRNYKNNFCIAAGKDRVEAAEYLISKFNVDVIILDDGFQHRRIKRDLDIVLIDAHNFLKEKFLNALTLPSGILREGLRNLNRAGFILQNNKNEGLPVIDDLKKYDKNILSLRYKTEYFIDNKNGILPDIKSKAILFSGIATDESFVEMVKAKDIEVTKVIKFSDHHNYSEQDINSLKDNYTEDSIFITTEKDFIKIREFKDFMNNYPVYYLKMSVELSKDSNELFSKLDEAVK